MSDEKEHDRLCRTNRDGRSCNCSLSFVPDVSELSGWKLIEAACERLKAIGIGPERAADVFGDAPEMLELLREAMAWLGDPSAYAQDDARGFDARARALLDKHRPG